MSQQYSSKKIIILFFCALLVVSSLPAPAFAIIYQPGETLNPSCPPTDANCAVNVANFTSGLTVGTTTPSSISNALYNTAGVLYWNGSQLSGISGGISSLAVPSGSNANGGSITNNVLTFSLADGTNPGLVSTGTQTFAGAKTFSSAPTLSSVTAGSVLFAGAGGAVSQNNSNLFWDNTNSRLGIGASTPNNTLQVADLIDFNNTDLNTKIGYQAGKNIISGAQSNTFLGNQAGYSAVSGGTNLADNNTGIGYRALYSNTTGYDNVANGYNTLYSNTTGAGNTANGSNALYFNTTGLSNTANGRDALYSNTTGSSNVANGRDALYSNTTGAANVANGVNALYSNTGGNFNTANGYNAGRYIADGLTANAISSSSVYLGSNTKALASGDTNEIVIGYDTTGVGSNSVVLGDNNITKTILKGNVGIGVVSPSSKLQVAGVIESTGLLFSESANAVLGFNYPDTTYDRRLRITAGKTDTADNSQGASIDLQGNAAGGSLDLVAGGATGALTFWTNNMQRAIVDASGNVGIGTTTPGSALDVKGTLRLSGSTSGYVGLAPAAVAGSTTYTLPSADGTSGQVLSTNGTGALSWTAASGSSQWTTSGSDIYYNTGNVAIGTTTPSAIAKLLISGAVSGVVNPGLVSGNGAVSNVGANTVITYTTASTFTPPTGVTSVEYLVVAGGGGGGSYGGGGGAGGMVTGTLSVSGSVTVSVGAGGTASTGRTVRGGQGGNSVFSTITATGGGGGGSDNNAATNSAINNGMAGGSGGGGSYFNSSLGGAGTSLQGNNGGGGLAGSLTASGGGGGAGAVGQTVSSNGVNGNGGAGASSSITGSSVVYAGGGGGGGGSSGGAGGSGGGGNGAGGFTVSNGTNNLGGGGGGGAGATPGTGGSGVVIVRFTTVANQTLLRVTDTGTVANSILAFFEGTSGQGCIIAGQTTSIACSSDITLKKNMNGLENALGNVLALKPVTFDWNTEADGAGNHIGFIAQDVEKIYPGLVVVDPNGKKALAYDRFAPILTKAIQELSAKIDRFFTVLENGWRRLTANELCLTDSTGALVCVTGENLKQILESVTTQESVSVDQSSAIEESAVPSDVTQ